jgi:methylenetetrahydrofolate reductase (NADPH)
VAGPGEPGDADARRRALARTATIEIIPLRGVDSAVTDIPPSTTITITCSPKWGVGRTVELTELIAGAGHQVVPHIAARQVADRAQLRSIVDRLAGAGVRNIYVIGGDAAVPIGEFASAVDLLDTLATLDHPFTDIGIAGYPEGHPKISDTELLNALLRKQRHATYLVSQLCFDTEVLLAWLRGTRREGVTLPLRVGIAGPIDTRTLVTLALRIGVGSSLRYLTKQHGLLGSVLRGGAYRPEHLLDELADAPDLDELGIDGVQLSSFNQIAATVEWQRRVAGTLAA